MIVFGSSTKISRQLSLCLDRRKKSASQKHQKLPVLTLPIQNLLNRDQQTHSHAKWGSCTWEGQMQETPWIDFNSRSY